MQFWVAFGGNSNTSILDFLLDTRHFYRKNLHVHAINSILQYSAIAKFN